MCRARTALKTEEEAFGPDPPANQRETLKAIQYVERAVTQAHGTWLVLQAFE